MTTALRQVAGRSNSTISYCPNPSNTSCITPGLQSVEDSDDLILFTQTGLSDPFYKNLNITAQFNWEYDKNPSPGKKESDYTYLFTLGYLWFN